MDKLISKYEKMISKEDDKQEIKWMQGDVKDFKKIRDAIKAGNQKKATSLSGNLGTDTREKLPRSTWAYLDLE